ncbi:hypothetical protein B5F40_00375 [Gordonibacter sp. An230]|nr:hypothetical protein B5F40_00375 [Gordonibacter sp. An230]
MRMHSARGHIFVDERWRLELAVAAACRAFAPRDSECLAPMPSPLDPECHASSSLQHTRVHQGDRIYCALPYYSYRYL